MLHWSGSLHLWKRMPDDEEVKRQQLWVESSLSTMMLRTGRLHVKLDPNILMVKRLRREEGGGAGRKTARERLSEVAADLFYRKGIRAVGVEEIVKQAGVAKISLYR